MIVTTGLSSEIVDQEIALLDQRLIAPVTTQAPDQPTYEDRIAINAYLVLAHACVEEFLEAHFLTLAAALADCEEQGMVTAHAARFAYAGSEYIPEKKRSPYKSRNLHGVMKVVLAEYTSQFVGINHGIRTANIERMVRGLGLLWSEFDSTCASHFPALDTLGSRRGGTAHLSTFSQAQVAVTTNVFPEDVREWVHDAVESAKAIGLYLNQLLSQDDSDTTSRAATI